MTIIPVHLMTGFLGSGKTTLVNELLRDPELSNTAVLINEFGEISIDHDLVAEVETDLVVTTTGCLCCTASSDVRTALEALLSRAARRELRPFRRVIVETTGLADPVPVVNSLIAASAAGPALAAYRLGGVVTLFDVMTGGVALDDHLEAVKQLALADAIILTKAELALDPASQRDIAHQRARVRRINPAAAVIDRHEGWEQIRALFLSDASYDLSGKGEDALAWLRSDAVLGHDAHDEGSADPNRHGDRVRAHCIVFDEPIDPRGFYLFLEALRISAGPKILRLKGLFALADDRDRPVVVHGVQHLIHPVARLEQWPTDDHRTRLVVVGRDLKIESIRRMIASLQVKRPLSRPAIPDPQAPITPTTGTEP